MSYSAVMNNESKPTSSHKGEKKKSTPLAVGDAAQSNDSVSHRQDMQKSEVSNKVNLPDELRSREKTFQATPHDMHHEREDETTALRREDIISSQLRSVLTDASDDTNSTSIGEKEGCGFLLFDSLSKTSRAKIEKRGQSEDDTKTLSKENIKKAYRENDIDALYKSTKSFMDVAQEENKALKNELDQLKSSFATYRSSSRIELLSEEVSAEVAETATLCEIALNSLLHLFNFLERTTKETSKNFDGIYRT